MSAYNIQRSAKVFFLGCVTFLLAEGQVTQPRKKTLADLCSVLTVGVVYVEIHAELECLPSHRVVWVEIQKDMYTG